MTITVSLGFCPKWYMADFYGRPLAAGYLAFFSSLNPTVQKLVYQDSGALFPWPTNTVPNQTAQGVLIDANGTQGPFYFKFDSDDPDNLYFIIAYDLAGNVQWTFVGNPTGGGSGGGGTTTVINIENLVANNVFYRNSGSLTSTTTFQRLAPSNHSAFTDTPALAGPDAVFYKNNTSATDTITFSQFSLGDPPLFPDVTPVYFITYACTGAGSSETIKNFQFPLTSDVQSLSGQPIQVAVWAKGNSGTQTINLKIRQFFGDGAGASADVYTDISPTATLTNQWALYTFGGVVPSVLGKTLGGCGNAATFYEVGMPLDADCSISFTKPAVYLGSIAPTTNYQTYDEIDSIINTPRTGDIRTGMNNFSPYGWVPMNDGTIGDASSNATTRANIDTFPLFNLIWTMMQGANEIYAPMYTSAGALVSYNTAILDFAAHRQISLTKSLGNVLAGRSATLPTGQTFTADNATETLTVTNTTSMGTAVPVMVSNSGGVLPTGLTAGTLYYSIYVSATTMKLASTIANAYAGTAVAFSDNGSGTNTVTVFAYALALNKGEEGHILTEAELAAHTHTVTLNNTNSTVMGFAGNVGPFAPVVGGTVGAINPSTFFLVNTSNAGSSPWYINVPGATSSSTGGNEAHNTVQPTTFMNVFMKL